MVLVVRANRVSFLIGLSTIVSVIDDGHPCLGVGAAYLHGGSHQVPIYPNLISVCKLLLCSHILRSPSQGSILSLR